MLLIALIGVVALLTLTQDRNKLKMMEKGTGAIDVQYEASIATGNEEDDLMAREFTYDWFTNKGALRLAGGIEVDLASKGNIKKGTTFPEEKDLVFGKVPAEDPNYDKYPVLANGNCDNIMPDAPVEIGYPVLNTEGKLCGLYDENLNVIPITSHMLRTAKANLEVSDKILAKAEEVGKKIIEDEEKTIKEEEDKLIEIEQKLDAEKKLEVPEELSKETVKGEDTKADTESKLKSLLKPKDPRQVDYRGLVFYQISKDKAVAYPSKVVPLVEQVGKLYVLSNESENFYKTSNSCNLEDYKYAKKGDVIIENDTLCGFSDGRGGIISIEQEFQIN